MHGFVVLFHCVVGLTEQFVVALLCSRFPDLCNECIQRWISLRISCSVGFLDVLLDKRTNSQRVLRGCYSCKGFFIFIFIVSALKKLLRFPNHRPICGAERPSRAVFPFVSSISSEVISEERDLCVRTRLGQSR